MVGRLEDVMGWYLMGWVDVVGRLLGGGVCVGLKILFEKKVVGWKP